MNIPRLTKKRVRRSFRPKVKPGEKVYYRVTDDKSKHKYRSLGALFNYLFFLDRNWSKKTKVEKYVNDQKVGNIKLIYDSMTNTVKEA